MKFSKLKNVNTMYCGSQISDFSVSCNPFVEIAFLLDADATPLESYHDQGIYCSFTLSISKQSES